MLHAHMLPVIKYAVFHQKMACSLFQITATSFVMLSFTLHKDACNTQSCRKKTRQQIRGLEVTLFPEGQVHGGSTLKKKLKVK